MSELVFLVEEPSMAMFLDTWLPTSFPGLEFRCLPHEGKADLKRSIPRKLRAWREPGVNFVILIDNDGRDCRVLKQELFTLCRDAGRPDTLIRIVCQELEAWYLGSPETLADAFGREDLIAAFGSKKFRDPDSILKPSLELARRIPEFQKISAAKSIAGRIHGRRNSSTSFAALVNGIRRSLPAVI
jgi:hypothetical protein